MKQGMSRGEKGGGRWKRDERDDEEGRGGGGVSRGEGGLEGEGGGAGIVIWFNLARGMPSCRAPFDAWCVCV